MDEKEWVTPESKELCSDADSESLGISGHHFVHLENDGVVPDVPMECPSFKAAAVVLCGGTDLCKALYPVNH